MFIALQKILQIHRPKLMFICETKMQSTQIEVVRYKLKFESCFAVDSTGRRGGLAMFWNSDICMQIKFFNMHHIDAELYMENKKQMRCTRMYGHPEMQQKKHTWTLFKRLTGLPYTLWLCFGDFNEIPHPYKKWGK